MSFSYNLDFRILSGGRQRIVENWAFDLGNFESMNYGSAQNAWNYNGSEDHMKSKTSINYLYQAYSGNSCPR